MTDRELMQQALEWADKHGEIVFAGGGWDAVNAMNAWAKAARKRLAQPEQEPVACKHEWFRTGAMEPKEHWCIKCGTFNTTPPQPEQEPVIGRWSLREVYFDEDGEPTMHRSTPQRTWVGLTRAERFEIEKAMSKYYDYQHECKTVCLPEFAAAIEAKLKEKNT